MRHFVLILTLLAVAGCGIDGPPEPPPPKEETERAAGDRGGTQVTVGVSGYMGGVMRR
ncbi:MAG: argininosuccinate lyase [Rhodobacteraceae bacterium]|nr:argininosuccinate lyase [Paracoccaceae bacterium]